MEPATYLGHIRADGERLAALAEGNLGLEVPSCPGWTVERLVGHVGRVHRDKLHIIENKIQTDPPAPPDPPESGLVQWYTDGLGQLLATLEDSDPDEQVFTWHDPDQSIGFWIRRMAHETVIHRIDGEIAIGDTRGVDAELAADGVDEILRVFLTGVPEWGAFTPGPGVVRIAASDADQEWTVRFGRFVGTSPRTGSEYDLEALEFEDAAEPDLTLSGNSADLDLWLWGRGPLDDIAHEGDASLAERLRSNAAGAT